MKCYIFGCGNLGLITIEQLKKIGYSDFIFIDNDRSKCGTEINGIEVFQLDSQVKDLETFSCNKDHLLFITIGTLKTKQVIRHQLFANGIYDWVDIYETDMLDVIAGHKRLEDIIGDRNSRISNNLSQINVDYNICESQVEYLKRHVRPADMLPATGKLRRIQLELVNFTDRIYRYIEKNCPVDIFVTDGALIGYERHNGFIPWDDDMDLSVMRKDRDILIKHFSDRGLFYIKQDQWCGEDIYDSKKIRELIKESDEGIVLVQERPMLRFFCLSKDDKLLCIDLFTYDYYNNGITLKEYQDYTREGDKILRESSRYAGEAVKEMDDYAMNSGLVSYEPTNIVMPSVLDFFYSGLWNITFLTYKEDYFPLEVADFEGIKVRIPANVRKILTQEYGDWNDLPSDVGTGHSVLDEI